MIQKLYKTENIIKVTPEETLSSIMSYFTSSHDAAFVFNDDNQFMGVVNPYYCLIKKSYPANTKARHCLVHPPKVDIKTSLVKTAQLMMETKIHYLPVFESTASGSKFKGIISARRILSGIKDSDKLKTTIGGFLGKRQRLVSIFEDDYISKAMPLFKQHRISKLIVVADDLKLRGILSYYDLIAFLVVPRERQGFSRKGNKTPILHTKVKNFMKSNVLTLYLNDSLSKAADLILKKQIGSVIIIDKEKFPVGIITTRDLLQAYVGRPQFLNIDVVTHDLSEKSITLVNNFLTHINQRFVKGALFDKAKIVIKEGKSGGVFEAVLSFFKMGNRTKVIKKEGKNLKQVLQEVAKKGRQAISRK